MQVYRRFNVASQDVHNSPALSEALEFIRSSLEGLTLGTKEAMRAQLMAEEALVRLIEQGDFRKDGTIQVSIRQFLGRVTIRLTVPGQAFDFGKTLELGAPFDEEEMSPDTAEAIQNILLSSFEDKLKYIHRRGCNHITVTALRSPFESLYWTLGALMLAVTAGLLMNTFASPELCDALNVRVLVPIRTVFMNGLKMCAIPVVFLSVASCVAQFGDPSGMKRVGANLFVCFVVSQFIAAGVGTGIFALFPSSRNVMNLAASSVTPALDASGFSLGDILVGLMPSNIIRPFLEGDMLQLIVLALFIGSAVGTLGTNTLRTFLNESSEVFMKVTRTLMRFIPLVVFCSIASMFLTTGSSVLLSVLGLYVMVMAGYAVMTAIYYLVPAFLCRLNPARMFSKSLPAMITAFTTCSSTAAIPDCLRVSDNLGISPKVYSLSVPLGTSINKNGTCIFLIVTGLFLTSLYGVNISPSLVLSGVISAIALTMGTAGIPGGGIVAVSLMVSQLGGPIESVGLIIGIYPLLEMACAPVNCMGNITSTLLVASRTGMLDEEAYNRTIV